MGCSKADARGLFLVQSPVTRLSVTINHGVVTGIEFGAQAKRAPETPLEQRVATELSEYLAGKRCSFTFPFHAEGTPFEARVWAELERIPYGQTRSYGEVARAIGEPNAARAVGAANGRNPVPVVVPCHRVVAAGGKLGGFGGGLELKRRLLALESSVGSALG